MVSSLGLDFAVFNVARLLFFLVILMEQLVQKQMEGLQTGSPPVNRFSWEINRISSFLMTPVLVKNARNATAYKPSGS
jgi:hypothetical protein